MGAELLNNTAHFRVFAPTQTEVLVVCDGAESIALTSEGNGYFSGMAAVAAGTRYRFKLGEDAFPDPASRYQPEGPHGPSQIIDPTFAWHDQAWRGATLLGQVISEIHIGTFTKDGTFAAAMAKLPHLKEVGVTCLELMPIADFPGDFGWGYDGVAWFAPYHGYGTPDDMRRFVDAAHALELAVILDVVYNHFGPDGNYLRAFSPSYFSTKHATEWGEALDFEGSAALRELVVANAGYWIEEFHCDGLRLDATQSIFDASERHVLKELGEVVRAKAAPRAAFVVAENEVQDTDLVRPTGHALDGLWNDDFHHSAIVAATGRNEAYYSDYRGSAQELLSAAKHGYLYQGQRYFWQKARRGTSARGLPRSAFVCCLENHDQVANSARGLRLHQLTSAAQLRALKTMLLLGPWTPMLFQGEEWNAAEPFLYFANHEAELSALVRKGRGDFLKQFPSLASDEAQASLADPGARQTFERCQLDWSQRDPHMLALHKDALALRATDPTFRAPQDLDGAVLSAHCFVMRSYGETHDCLMVTNLGRTLELNPGPEPLLAPPRGGRWRVALSSESTRYGGCGSPPPEVDGGFTFFGQSCVVLTSEKSA